MTLSHDFVPDALKGHTTGRHKDVTGGPFQDVPIVGITSITHQLKKVVGKDPKTQKELPPTFPQKAGEYYMLVDEGYGSSDKSGDFPLHFHKIKIALPMVYNHGDAKFGPYTEVEHQETILISDPHKLIGWKSEWDGHSLDIQAAYGVPANWEGITGTPEDWKGRRVLTGRDLSPEGMVLKTDECALVVEKWGPSIFSMDPTTGIVKSKLIP